MGHESTSHRPGAPVSEPSVMVSSDNWMKRSLIPDTSYPKAILRIREAASLMQIEERSSLTETGTLPANVVHEVLWGLEHVINEDTSFPILSVPISL